MRLHRRLTVTMAVILLIGLVVTDLITYGSLRSFLDGRLDNQLGSSQRLVVRYLTYAERRGHAVDDRAIDDRVSDEVYVIVLSKTGRTVLVRPAEVEPGHDEARPEVPRSVRLSSLALQQGGAYKPNPDDFDLSAKDGAQYRASAAAVPQGVVISAVSLAQTNATLSSLISIEVAVSLVVLVLLCALALWTIRRGLRPLDDMATTAGAIAAGDLSRRVEPGDDKSEVGRLGQALNAMLSQIEAGFDEKSASEARLRQFVADASHELRTPLTSIRGYVELLRKGALPDEEEQVRALRRVEHEAKRMSGLVDDLLLLARLDQGRPLERRPVDLRRICRDAVDDAQMAEPTRPVELVASGSVTVAADRDRMAQVAHNLVGNALAHTRRGSPVRVEVAAKDGLGVVRVVDRGPGLSGSQLERVFDRFYRADAARRRAGSGLGLAIVRAIAEALGGRAWAEPAPEGGTVFSVAIPLYEPPAPAHDADTAEAAPPPAQPAPPPKTAQPAPPPKTAQRALRGEPTLRG